MLHRDDDRFDLFLSAEGRVGPRSRNIAGPGVSRRANADLEATLRRGSARAVAGAAIGAVAASNPVTAALYAAYTVAKYAYPIVKVGVEEKMRTGDTDRAVERMAQETVNQVGRAAVDVTVSAVADAVVDGAVKASGITANETTKRFVSSAVSETISEVIK